MLKPPAPLPISTCHHLITPGRWQGSCQEYQFRDSPPSLALRVWSPPFSTSSSKDMSYWSMICWSCIHILVFSISLSPCARSLEYIILECTPSPSYFGWKSETTTWMEWDPSSRLDVTSWLGWNCSSAQLTLFSISSCHLSSANPQSSDLLACYHAFCYLLWRSFLSCWLLECTRKILALSKPASSSKLSTSA